MLLYIAWLQRGGGHRAKLSRTASPHQTALVLNTATIREHTLIAETIAVLLGAQFTNEVKRERERER